MRIRSALFRYGIAAIVFIALLLLPFGLQRLTGFSFDTTFLIILAMVGCAWYLGRGPGLLIAVLFEAALVYFSPQSFTPRSAVITFNRLLLFFGIVLFASARRNAERTLTDQRELLKVTLASIGDAVITTDLDGKINFLNSTAEILTGWVESDAHGQPLVDIFRIVDEESGGSLDIAPEKIPQGLVTTWKGSKSALIGKSGRKIPIDHNEAPIKDSEGKVIGAVIVFRDVSEKRRSERERDTALISERAARIEAESANRLKDEFLATVSHELRTPLNAILGWAAMVKRTPQDTEAVQNALDIIERNARAQNEIIGDILDVSRIVSGKLDVDPKTMDLVPVIRAAVDSLRPSAAGNHIELRTNFAVAEVIISGDAERLQQVFWNLITNAIKFTRANGSVEVSMRADNGNAFIEIKDTGIGIEPQFLPHIFERFRQVDSSMKRAHGGLGLGLAIARHITELHKGTVSVYSDGVGLGSTFTVTLPLMIAIPKEIPAPTNGHATSERIIDFSTVRILVVDDNKDSLDICRQILEEYGADVRTAESSPEAFQTFTDWKPDVLISDLGMPHEDGFDLIAKIRGLGAENGGLLPAAALTAYARSKDRQDALAAGFDAHIPKPVDGATLAGIIHELLLKNGSQN